SLNTFAGTNNFLLSNDVGQLLFGDRAEGSAGRVAHSLSNETNLGGGWRTLEVMRRIWVAYPLRGSQRVGSSPLVFLPFLSFLHFTLYPSSTALPPSHNSTSCSTANP